MIYGIGTDIAAVARFEALLAKHGERIGHRILAPAEWPDFETDPHPARFLAKRFAAKEAFGKALGTGLRHPVTLQHLQVVHSDLGAPSFKFDSSVQSLLEQKGIWRHHLSLSDEHSMAVAFVILEERRL